jgi:hypothetical protein
MSKKASFKKGPLSPEDRRALEIRRGVLLAHVAIEAIVVLCCWAFSWWSGHYQPHGSAGLDFAKPGAECFQARYITWAAIAAFFFTSYDLVANADFQWPPLLASAFALGCAGQVTYQALGYKDEVLRQLMLVERKQQAVAIAPVASGTPTGVAPVASGSKAEAEPYSFKIDPGLMVVLFGSFSMVVLSSYLTFFARREEQ